MYVNIFYYLWILLQVIIGYNLILPVLLFCFYKIKGGKTRSLLKHPVSAEDGDYGIIVTAYEHTQTLPAVVDSLLRLNYSRYLIYIVADKCDVSQLHFTDKRVIVLRPKETLGSNTRSHFYAIERFERNHDRLTIIDSDNLVDPEYLNELNEYFNLGYVAVQGVRKAKNLDTVYACLDAARDMYYHFYDGEVLFGAGSSATLSGSGMAFTVQIYKNCLAHLDITGAGFDKVLQYQLLNSNNRISFAKDAVVYDEKTSKSDQLVKQRARWINTWFRYFTFGFKLTGKGIRNLNWNQLLFGFILLRPPLFIFIILSAIFIVLNIFIQPVVALIWFIAFIIFIAGFVIGIAQSKPDKRVYRSLVRIPLFMFYQVLSLLKVRRANAFSVATQHYHEHTIEELRS
ncbi:glycosyltransferase family 2 protein [Panacibacter ginsenosidivorans]|uniref:Glycosyltransferase family 2 protein n=1 Tax=Panacibacter ginsenosidivorans TaxID=1813871 RepID=A0A5B8V5H7_9BACT|nr:glycosyltransferase [Panacibacter ginsenosidivorans]QEC66640.1 glycosyltransferase family 2 protein [Panacibacter ginsenosidivorans]